MKEEILQRLGLLGGDISALVAQVRKLQSEVSEKDETIRRQGIEISRSYTSEKQHIQAFEALESLRKAMCETNKAGLGWSFDSISKRGGIPALMRILFGELEVPQPKNTPLEIHLSVAYAHCLDLVIALLSVVDPYTGKKVAGARHAGNATSEQLVILIDEWFAWTCSPSFGSVAPHHPFRSALMVSEDVWAHIMDCMKKKPKSKVYSIGEIHTLSDKQISDLAEFAIKDTDYEARDFLARHYNGLPKTIESKAFKLIGKVKGIYPRRVPLDIQKKYYMGQPFDNVTEWLSLCDMDKKAKEQYMREYLSRK